MTVRHSPATMCQTFSSFDVETRTSHARLPRCLTFNPIARYTPPAVATAQAERHGNAVNPAWALM